MPYILRLKAEEIEQPGTVSLFLALRSGLLLAAWESGTVIS